MDDRVVETARRMRAFNRFYTEVIGALDDRHEGLSLTLAESRCLFTVQRLGDPDIGRIAETLQLDLGYVSRLVSRLERAGRICRSGAADDHRRRLVTLTAEGAALFDEVAERSDARMAALVGHLEPAQIDELLAAMETIHRLIEPKESA